ncbi:MAG: hypothetical protein MUO22_05135 [Sedimentisphaerales bacterium]|nr:hypothetical protein [Sedimentisphaerales bacterium]
MIIECPHCESKVDGEVIGEHESDELAHYAKACVDVEYKFPLGSGDWQELEGVANRTDYGCTVSGRIGSSPSYALYSIGFRVCR